VPLAAFPKCYLDDLMSGEMGLSEWFDVAERLDLDGVEFYWGITPDPDESPEELGRVREQLDERGLSAPMMVYSPDFTHPDRQTRREEIEREKHAIRAIDRLGGSYCRVLSGQRRPAVDRDEGIEWAAECITELLPFAADHDVTLVLENHYKDDYWEYPEFAQEMTAFLDLLDRIPEHPNFGVNYDPSNAIIADDDPIKLLEAVGERVETMHASDRYVEGGDIEDLRNVEREGETGYADMLTHGVVGEGMIDYDELFGVLAEVGFEGWISIEDGYDASVGERHLSESADFLREKMVAHGVP
jgi:sugar phosphate isomerase/epimerase